jgi:hypothetical protein
LIKGITANDTRSYPLDGGRRKGVVGDLLLLGIDKGDGDGGYGGDGHANRYVLLGDGDHC